MMFYLAASDPHLLRVVNDHWQQDEIEHIGQFSLSSGGLIYRLGKQRLLGCLQDGLFQVDFSMDFLDSDEMIYNLWISCLFHQSMGGIWT